MTFLAYDGFETEHGRRIPVCGPNNGSPWSRPVLHILLDNHPELKDRLRPTRLLLNTGESFAYIMSWRHYFGYPNELSAPSTIRENFKWLSSEPRLLKAFQTGQATLVFIDWYEGVWTPGSYYYHHNDKFSCLCNTFDIPPRNVMFVDGNAQAKNYTREHTPRFEYANIFESFSLSMYHNAHTVPDPYIIEHLNKKPYRYLSYARHWNTMRQYFTFDLFDRNLLKYGLVSCSNEPPANSPYQSFMEGISRWTPGVSVAQAHAFLLKLPLTLDADLSVNQAHVINVQHHLDTDISIIHETHSNPESVFLSEKTYRAIFMKHPFLMMGSPGLLARLREDGYQTYGSVFDESYDNEPDLQKRKNMVLDELEKFIKLDTTERKRKLDEAQVIARFNLDHFMAQTSRPKFTQGLVDSLRL